MKFMKQTKKKLVSLSIMSLLCLGSFAGCTDSSENNVVIYTNADNEAVEVMKKTLDENGYSGKYAFQTFGTSELGGKLLAESNNIEADLITMSSFYIDSAQQKNKMFRDLNFEVHTLDSYPKYYAPITSQEGSLFYNTKLLEEHHLKAPKSIKDLADPIYRGQITLTDINSSSTAWLLVQALVHEYGEEETVNILAKIYKNADGHIESSGTAPLTKVKAGEKTIGFGLRHQAVQAKENGLPIEYIDPIEGNFSLTESVAVIDKGEKSKKLAMDMAKTIVEKARKDMMKYYPNSLYQGESIDPSNHSSYPKVFQENLTIDLLSKHKELSEKAKEKSKHDSL